MQDLSEPVATDDVPGADMQVDWRVLIEYIERKGPGLVKAFRGAALRDIKACEAEYRIALPSLYVDFLLTMGEKSGPIRPFGPTHVHSFSELLDLLPPEDYPADRLFRVAFEGDDDALA